MWVEITSNSSKMCKHVKALHLKNYRDKKKEYVIEGFRLVKDALESNAPVKSIMVSDSFVSNAISEEILKEISGRNISIYKVSDNILKDISDTETPQGIVGVVAAPQQTIKDIHICGDSLFVLCDCVQDPGNLGTIIRTADAAGADGVILSKGCVDVYNPKVVRSTMGAIFHFPVIKVDNLTETILYLKQRNLSIVSGYLEAADYHFDIDMKKGTVIVIGNEANGISSEVISLSDYLIKIPIPGRAESLNAAIAAGILIYEAVRQRMKKS